MTLDHDTRGQEPDAHEPTIADEHRMLAESLEQDIIQLRRALTEHLAGLRPEEINQYHMEALIKASDSTQFAIADLTKG